MHHNSFSQMPVHGYLNFFQVFTVKWKAVINILTYKSLLYLCKYIFLLDKFLDGDLLWIKSSFSDVEIYKDNIGQNVCNLISQ